MVSAGHQVKLHAELQFLGSTLVTDLHLSVINASSVSVPHTDVYLLAGRVVNMNTYLDGGNGLRYVHTCSETGPEPLCHYSKGENFSVMIVFNASH